ncbi:MAG TPA: type I-C CRISPR-associated protein Cas7/Csd2 [Candidatus Atribacteria bacterium]|nr:type I-C CRISPR-associated protein Cas7/Csd2 [Candidatus Atribacteria bacterium]
MAIKNRYEFVYYVECINGNPNGDPDMGNSPRIDPQDMRGLISDVAVKRRIRNYVTIEKGNKPPYGIIVQQSTNMNRFIAQANEECGSTAKDGTKEKVDSARKWICQNFYDVRAFGGVLTTGANAGQVRGPIQLTFMKSVDPILPMDISITRMSVTEDIKVDGKGIPSSEDYKKWEDNQPVDKLRTMGRKQLIPYGLYEGRGFISANLAEDTEFSDEDLSLFVRALANMYEHDRSASKGQMSTILPIIFFRHVGTDSDLNQRANQAKLGCAPAHKLFELISIKKREGVEVPRSYQDYKLTLNISGLPKGVEAGFALPDGNIVWDNLPDVYSWIELK